MMKRFILVYFNYRLRPPDEELLPELELDERLGVE